LPKKIKIGWIGSGFVGQVAHLYSYSQIPSANIVALAELRQDLGFRVANKFNIKKLYNNHSELLENEKDLDAIVLIVRRHHTALLAKEILKKNINLFTEKPMAPNLSIAKSLTNLAIKKNLHYVIGNMRRHDDGVKYTKKIFSNFLLNKELGDFISYRSYCYAGGDYCNIDGYLKTKEKNFIGKKSPIAPNWIKKDQKKQFEKFHNYFVHNINIINYYFNYKVKVYKKILQKNGGSILFDHNSFYGQFDFAYLNSNIWEEGIDFYFTNGHINLKLPPAFLRNQASSLTIYNGNSNSYYQPRFDWNWSFKNQAESFIKTLNKNETNICDARFSINDLKIIEDIWKI
tara:strand:- start:1543 stop:2577 length:1035 start_codon:yes stop_codon:yes gene_type:complete